MFFIWIVLKKSDALFLHLRVTLNLLKVIVLIFLQVDLLNDIAHPPRILTNFSQAIQPATFKRDLDSYLKTRAPVTFLSELRSHLQVRKLTYAIV